MTQLALKWPFSFPPHPTSAFALPGKTEDTKHAFKSRTKNLIEFFIFPGMWPPIANQLQGLAVVQQHVY